MGKVAIVTDSNSGITQKEAKELGIQVLPMPFYINGELFFEDITLTQEEFYQRLAEDADSSTSQPSPGDVVDLWDKLLEEYDEIVHIPMSSGLSASCETAIGLAEDYDGRVQVVNNHRISVPQRNSVSDAQILAGQGCSAKEIKAELERMAFDSIIYIGVDTLEYLVKGGRIGKVTATAGTLLQIKPIITFASDGQLQSVAKVRGRGQVMDKLVAMAVKACGEHRRYNLAVANGGAPAEMELVRQKLITALPDYDHIWEGEIDGTLSVYIGDGVLGAAVQVLD